MNGERLFKLAFVAPFRTDNETYNTPGGHMREYGNRIVGSAIGGVGAGILGGLVGGRKGATIAGTAGGIVGNLTSLHKSEDMAKVKRTDLGQYLARMIGDTVGSKVIPIVGGGAADYAISRKLQDHSVPEED